MRRFLSILTVEMLVFGLMIHPPAAQAQSPNSITPIQHVVVIFQENVSFDHYFGTYPNATNPQGEPAFTAAANTPSVNGLDDWRRFDDQQSEYECRQRRGRDESLPAGPLAGRNLRSESQLHAGANGDAQRPDGHVSGVDRYRGNH